MAPRFPSNNGKTSAAIPSAPITCAKRFKDLSLDWLSLDSWAVLAAVVLVLAIVIGTLPRVPW